MLLLRTDVQQDRREVANSEREVAAGSGYFECGRQPETDAAGIRIGVRGQDHLYSSHQALSPGGVHRNAPELALNAISNLPQNWGPGGHRQAKVREGEIPP